MAPVAVQPPEVQFAQRLAANEKRIRDRALKKLRGYIGVRTQRPGGTDRGGPVRGPGGRTGTGLGTGTGPGAWRGQRWPRRSDGVGTEGSTTCAP